MGANCCGGETREKKESNLRQMQLSQVRKDELDQMDEKAIVKLQANARGYITRRHVHETHGFSVSPNAARSKVQAGQVAAIKKIRDSLPEFVYG